MDNASALPKTEEEEKVEDEMQLEEAKDEGEEKEDGNVKGLSEEIKVEESSNEVTKNEGLGDQEDFEIDPEP
jgi:hypothetical protein